jgi:ribosomal protein S18 acetylase RimI-like enzyme
VSDTLDVRRAGPEDVDEIVGMLSEAAAWLIAQGIRQWPDPFPRDRVEALAGRGDFHVARLDGETVGTLALLWSDPTFWGERPDDAGYVHALAVRRSCAGRGLGARLLGWAEERVARAGRGYLRLDCRAENSALRRYYERHGFEPRGEVAVDEFTSALYERRCRAGARGRSRPDAQAGEPGPAAGESAQIHCEPVTDAHVFQRYARGGNEGGPATPPRREGVRLRGDGVSTKSAFEWREFWRARQMRESKLLLWAVWAPRGRTPPGEYDARAPRIAALLGVRASEAATAEERGPIHGDVLALEPAPTDAPAAAGKIIARVEASTA